MESIPHDLDRINATDPQALTRLLDLPELTVTHIEQVQWLARRYIHCTVCSPQGVCSTCGQPSAHIHQYHSRLDRFGPAAGPR